MTSMALTYPDFFDRQRIELEVVYVSPFKSNRRVFEGDSHTIPINSQMTFDVWDIYKANPG